MSGRTKMLDLVEAQVIEGYRNGLTLRELAKTYEVSAGTVRNLLITGNVPLRARGRRKVHVDAATPTEADPAEVHDAPDAADFPPFNV